MIESSDFRIKVVDLFAGAGGFGLGFSMANKHIDLVLSLEKDKWAVETLKANSNHTIIENDIKSFDTPEQIKLVCPVSPDIIIGGPPCQGFSQASGKADPSDPRNSLFKHYAQWVAVLQPKIFVMENVRGILTQTNEKGEKVIDIIIATFKACNYAIEVWELNAASYGVPQSRDRVFIVGNNYGEKLLPPPVTHFLPEEKIKLNSSIKAAYLKKAVTVIEAIGDLPQLAAGAGEEISSYIAGVTSDFQKMCRGNNKILFNHVSMKHTDRIVKRYERILEGDTLTNIPAELMVRKRNGNGELSDIVFSSNYRHLKPEMIAYTIPASFYSNFIHPNQARNITSREAARLQSFPDSYIFKGKRTQISSKLLKKIGKENENYLSQYNQIGNAVPPLLAKAIASHLFNFLKKKSTTLTKVKSANKLKEFVEQI